MNKLLKIVKEVLRQGRLHIMPLGFMAIMGGAASVGEINSMTAVKALFLSVVTSFAASAPNDYFDADIDSRLERKDFFGTRVSNKELGKTVAVSSIVTAVIVSIFTGGFTGFSMLMVTLLSILYSVPPFRFKGRAPLDSICNGLGVFFIFGMGVGLVGGGFNSIIPGAYWFSLILAGIHGITAIPDMKEDKKEDLTTLPMLLGKNNTVRLTQIIIVGALYFEQFSLLTSSFLVSVFLGLFILWKDWDEINLNYWLIIGVIYCSLYFAIYAVMRGILNLRYLPF